MAQVDLGEKVIAKLRERVKRDVPTRPEAFGPPTQQKFLRLGAPQKAVAQQGAYAPPISGVLPPPRQEGMGIYAPPGIPGAPAGMSPELAQEAQQMEQMSSSMAQPPPAPQGAAQAAPAGVVPASALDLMRQQGGM
jgi:hypothetical protein